MSNPPAKFGLVDAIIFGGFAALADFLSIIPVLGTLFLFTFWGFFKMMRISAPLPVGSMFIKVVPLLSITPLCLGYVWRVYKRNQPGGVLSVVSDVVKPTEALASVAALHILPKEGEDEKRKAA